MDRHCAMGGIFMCLFPCGCGRVETVVGLEAVNTSPVTDDATLPVLPDARVPEPPDATDAGGAEDMGPDDAAPDDASDSNLTEVSVTCAAPGDGSACVDTLSNIGAGDFHIRFVVTTTETGLIALVNQRATCGYAMFWDLRAYPDHMVFETDDGLPGIGHYTHIDTTNVHVTDGQPHCIVAQRVNGTATIFVDGVLSGSGPSPAVLRQLSPLARGQDACDGPRTSDAGCPTMCHDGTQPFVGTLANLCVTSP